MQKWEYRVVALPFERGILGTQFYNGAELNQHLNWLGELGWELVQISVLQTNGYSNQILATFKRPALQNSEKETDQTGQTG